MALTDGLLGPVLGGVLGFLGAVVAAVIAYALARRRTIQRTDEENTQQTCEESLEIEIPMYVMGVSSTSNTGELLKGPAIIEGPPFPDRTPNTEHKRTYS
ncbi:hypothetical protein GGR57DRAFT_507855 [Xylariaceae sp. FL1272]|nr:hypothetical protein GGR57DRAFT_507855 [Xylariaceae sp. FL1272]